MRPLEHADEGAGDNPAPSVSRSGGADDVVAL